VSWSAYVRPGHSRYGLRTGGAAASAGLAAIRITSLYIPVLTINTCLYSRLPVGTVLSGLPWSTVVLSRCPGGPPALLYVFSDPYPIERCVTRLSAVLSHSTFAVEGVSACSTITVPIPKGALRHSGCRHNFEYY
jgi:hypothetical protein